MNELQRQCPVTGDACGNAACRTEEGCKAKADEILRFSPDAMEEAIIRAAKELGIDPELYATFVYDIAFGAGSSGTLYTDGPSPF
jgi:hypothetical protein